jgi:hypoxanthine phosphoribosyltransferase
MMTEVSFPAILKALNNLQLADCEVVVGIGKGGIVPASLVACKLGCELKIIRFNYRNRDNVPQHSRPRLLNNTRLPKGASRILIVDDVSVSGKTLDEAKTLFKNCRVKTMAFTGKADYVLFPEISGCVKWPWSNYEK